jgi:hypothetical protein
MNTKSTPMTIYRIKELTEATAPHFFTRSTMKFFHQTMSGFSLKKQPDGRTRISQPMRDHSGRVVGETVRFFNPETNKLDLQ